MINRLAVAILLSASAIALIPAQERADNRGAPKLVVMLVVDQMRTGYLEQYGRHFTGGLKRLRDEGTWFRRGAYPYLNTVTCAGHATIGTGEFPYRHGMVLNRWWDRATSRTRLCTEDPAAQNITHAGPSNGHDSGESLLAPTLASRIRQDYRGRSVVLSLKPRSAIGLSGRGAGTVIWQERGNLATSQSFAPAVPEWLVTFANANPLSADAGKTWERMLPISAYTGKDELKGERFPTGWNGQFPHPIGVPAEQLEAQWQRTPLADEYLVRIAIHALDTQKLGQGEGTDYLGVSFSTLDLVGHQFGPQSHEVQDILFRLDATIGTLLAALDARLGKNGYVLGLSADHGVSALTETTGGGRHLAAEISATIDKALEPLLGPGKHVAHTEYTDVYFAPGVFETIVDSPKAWRAVRDALTGLPGILHVYRSDEISSAGARTSSDRARRAAALSYHPARSGDVIIVPKENWLFSSAAATHGTFHPYDQQVPVILFGAGVEARTLDTPATPADIAPTLAALAGLRFETESGKPLLTRRPAWAPQ